MIKYHNHYQQRRTRNFTSASPPLTSLNSTKFEDDLQQLAKINKPGGLTIFSQ